MLGNIFNCIKILKNKIILRYPNLLRNRLFLFCRACYHEFEYLLTREENILSESYGARTYFKKNIEKINAVKSYLQDDESKKTYMSIIEYRKNEFFRQLFSKKEDAPIYHGLENQYFVNEFFKYEENEILVDCGAYTGDSVEAFSKACPNYCKIIALEPDTNNFKKLQENYGKEERVFLINAGVWEKNDTLIFSMEKFGYASNLSKDNKSKKNKISIDVFALDTMNEIKCSKITFIKMDVEGVELEALKGAKETIIKDKPRLAICIYHYNRHFIEIPEYIRSIVPEYKFWIRHHCKEYLHETVLYAKC